MNTQKINKKNESRTVGARITESMYEELHDFLEGDTHLSVSDYLRDLIRKDLESKLGEQNA
jgi:Arc/MetJ-type ribon-helix-helix transcriptional regulator